jgi:hypothetical protein
MMEDESDHDYDYEYDSDEEEDEFTRDPTSWLNRKQVFLLKEQHLCSVFYNIDAFREASQYNTAVEEVHLRTQLEEEDEEDDIDDDRYYELWDDMGRALGNLQNLGMLSFKSFGDMDFRALACILRHTKHVSRIHISCPFRQNGRRAPEHIGDAIRWHPSLGEFKLNDISSGNYDNLLSALATVPNLKSVDLRLASRPIAALLARLPQARFNADSLSQLMLSPSLRNVAFNGFSFGDAHQQGFLDALSTESTVTDLSFSACQLSPPCIASIGDALKMNSTLSRLRVDAHSFDKACCNAIADALLVNKTLAKLHLSGRMVEGDSSYIEVVLSALQSNTKLSDLTVALWGTTYWNETLSDVLRKSLEINSALKRLHLFGFLTDVTCLRLIPFLVMNKALVELKMSGGREQLTAAVCLEVASFLEGNESLTALDISTGPMSHPDRLATIAKLKNTTLLYLRLGWRDRNRVSAEETKALTAEIKGNYRIEELDVCGQNLWKGELGVVLRLNQAGRRCLIQDASLVNGVEVLNKVKDDLDCLFYHLLENPTLCYGVRRETSDAKSSDRGSPAKRQVVDVGYLHR